MLRLRDKICVLAPAPFEPDSVHTDVLKFILMGCDAGRWVFAKV
jgi:hypothetical protein